MEFPKLNPIGIGNSLVISGHVYNANYQRAKWLLDNIVKKRLPQEFKSPSARGLYENEFRQQLWCFQRGIGDMFWTCRAEVLVFINGVYIGDDERFRLFLNQNFAISLPVPSLTSPEIQQECKQDFLNTIAQDTTGKFVYLDIGLDGKYIGSLVICLYVNYCPVSCDYFLHYVRTSLEEKQNYNLPGYVQTKIHRICSPSFLQCGDIQQPTPIFSDECFDVLHDRRGVVSFSNVGPDTNKCQFIISLNPNPWMNRKYVAFGQVVEGMGVLDRIEAVPTYYESPKQDIEIVACGTLPLDGSREFSLDGNTMNISEVPPVVSSMDFYDLMSVPDESDLHFDIKQFLVEEITKLPLPVKDQPHPDDTRSDSLVAERYVQGLYTMPREVQVYAQHTRDTFHYESVEDVPCEPSADSKASGIEPKVAGKFSERDPKQYYSLTSDNSKPYAGLPAEKLIGKTDEEILRMFHADTVSSDVTRSSYITGDLSFLADSVLNFNEDRVDSETFALEEGGGSDTLGGFKESEEGLEVEEEE